MSALTTPPAADYVAGLEAALLMAAYSLELSALTANPAKRAIVRGFADEARAARAALDEAL
jgi:hypothetical protein